MIYRSTDLLICVQRVKLNGFYSTKNYPGHLRRIRFRAPDSGQHADTLSRWVPEFLTNDKASASTITARYESRWQVELYKWIKQLLRIKASSSS